MSNPQRLKLWWKHAVVYQIYPASFCDSNGDGIGDIPGIISKLDYLCSLGINVIWVSPMYESPQADMGYDISNYEDVHRPYGTLEDMDTLIRETHARGMKIMLDLVINHTSEEHAWFKESRAGKDSPKRDWYIWQPAKYTPDGKRVPPNNWRSIFGAGSAWEWDEQSGEYYLHLFCKEQPDLNWENPATRKAIYETAMEFWLKRGVDGFRVDTVNLYSKTPQFPDAPITDPEAPFQPAFVMYCNGPRMQEYLAEMNEILEKYGAITVGECGSTPDLNRIIQYVSAEAKQLSMVFQFDVVDVGLGKRTKFDTVPGNWELPEFKKGFERLQGVIRGTDAWTTVFLENHDQARSVSRFTNDSPEHRVAGAKMLALLQACLSGTQYVYQGQEIGSVNAPKDEYPLENYLDVDSILYMKDVRERLGEEGVPKAFDALQYMARDHSRLPMAWNGECKYGGFSEAAEKAGISVREPWMKPHPYAKEINVASQLHDPNSVLAFWRKALAFRREHQDLLVYGDYRVLRVDDKDLYMFVKENPLGGPTKAFVVLNFTAEEKRWEQPTAQELQFEGAQAKLVPLLSTHGDKAKDETLAPFEGRVYLVTTN